MSWRDSPFRPPVDPGLQVERTALAWRRTTLAMGAGTLVIARFSLLDAAGPAVALGLACAGVACVVWSLLVIARRTRHARAHAEAGFALVARDGQLAAAMTAVVVLLAVAEIVAALRR